MPDPECYPCPNLANQPPNEMELENREKKMANRRIQHIGFEL
jgi:hypothetical protein